MKRVIVTNNKKVAEKLSDKAEIKYIKAPAPQVFEEARAIASKGGKLLIDPTREPVKTFYRSLPFIVDDSEPNENTINTLDSLIEKMRKTPGAFSKEPVMAGMHENKDLDTVMKVLG